MAERNRNLNKDDLELFNSLSPIFNKAQIKLINQKTPPSEIETKIVDGKKIKSVKAHYAKRMALLIFGGCYDFEIKDQIIVSKSEIKTTARLTIYRLSDGKSFYREQNGSYKGYICADGFKSSSSDAFKKCLSEFGLFWDIYSSDSIEEKQLPEKSEKSYQNSKTIDNLESGLKRCTTIEDCKFEFDKFITHIEESIVLPAIDKI